MTGKFSVLCVYEIKKFIGLPKGLIDMGGPHTTRSVAEIRCFSFILLNSFFPLKSKFPVPVLGSCIGSVASGRGNQQGQVV